MPCLRMALPGQGHQACADGSDRQGIADGAAGQRDAVHRMRGLRACLPRTTQAGHFGEGLEVHGEVRPTSKETEK